MYTVSTSPASKVSGAKKGSVKISKCCIISATFCRQRIRLYKTPHNSTRLAEDEADGEGTWWTGGSCSRADKEQRTGERTEPSEQREEEDKVKGSKWIYCIPHDGG